MISSHIIYLLQWVPSHIHIWFLPSWKDFGLNCNWLIIRNLIYFLNFETLTWQFRIILIINLMWHNSWFFPDRVFFFCPPSAPLSEFHIDKLNRNFLLLGFLFLCSLLGRVTYFPCRFFWTSLQLKFKIGTGPPGCPHWAYLVNIARYRGVVLDARAWQRRRSSSANRSTQYYSYWLISEQKCIALFCMQNLLDNLLHNSWSGLLSYMFCFLMTFLLRNRNIVINNHRILISNNILNI